MFDLFVRTFNDWRVARDGPETLERNADQPRKAVLVRRRDGDRIEPPATGKGR